MGTYIYTVKDDMGHDLYGLLDGDSVKDVRKKVRASNTFFVSAKPFNRKTLQNKKIKFQTLIMFTYRLATLVEAGVPVLSAMGILWRQTEDQTVQLAISHMQKQLEEGNQISEAMRSFPNMFPLMYTSLIKVGEKGGALVQVLNKLSEYLEYKAAIIAKAKKATLYPMIVLLFSFVVVISMFIFIVPIFQKLLLRLDVELPAITKFVLVISQIMRSGFFWVGIVISFLVVGFIYKKMREVPWIAGRIDSFILSIPYFGDIIMAISLSQLVRSLTILLGAGVPVMESLSVANTTSSNRRVVEDINRVKDSIEQGGSLYESFRSVRIFPLMLIEMIGIGESTGRMVQILEKITKHFDNEVDYQINKFLTILEPMMIIMVGGVVIVTLLSIYLPVISIWQGIMD